ncbi:hypothetical protein PD374_17440 [Pseudomonas sp. WCS374]|nr:hypothetical protein PD374_17440 [Pseudomonas sp. WCS374]
MSLEHFGAERPLHIVVELWSTAMRPPQTTVEHLSTATLSHEALSVLIIAQGRLGALIPGRRETLALVTLYSEHASDLADGLLARLPREQLSRTLRGLS